MTKDEANAVLKMDTGELVNYDLVDSALLDNLQTQVASHGDYTVILAEEKKAEIAELSEELDSRAEENAAALQALREQHSAELDAKEAEITGLKATIKEQLKYIDAVSTLPDAIELAAVIEKQRRHDELMAAIADAEAKKKAAEEELAKEDSGSVVVVSV